MKKKIVKALIVFTVFSTLMGCVNKNIKKDSLTVSTNTSTTVESETVITKPKELTNLEAVENVKKVVGNIPKDYFVELDHTEKRDGKDYFVIRFFEKVIDNSETGESHTVTARWYYVEKATAEIFELDEAGNKLNKVK